MKATLDRWFGSSATLLALRIAMTVAWAWIAVTTLVGPGARSGLALGWQLLGFGGFIVALWANLHRAPRARTTPRIWLLLGVQLLAGITMATDLMLIVAMELPLVLKPRNAVVSFVGLLALFTAVGLAMARAGQFVAAPELAGVPPQLQVGLTLGLVAGWELLAFCGGMLAATEIRARRDVDRLAAALTLANAQLEESSREAERLHIARELHDTVGHRLAALGVSLDLESRRAEGASAASLREARDSTQQLLAEVREVVSAMREEQPIDLKRAIASLISGLGGLEIALSITPDLQVRDAACAHALYRCAQEALTNVLRHAQATRVRVELRQDANFVALAIRDDGEGADPLREGHGLAGMRERLQALGGTIIVETRRGQGFAVVARVPCARAGR
ncbi:MAG: sensor histidine kinase [Candidatus Eisenbacteria bacterium]